MATPTQPTSTPQRKTKTTIYMAPEVAVAAKVFAAATGTSESRVIEEAVRTYIHVRRDQTRNDLASILDRIAEEAPPLSEEEAMLLASEELESARAARRRSR
jgi:hypothetical protein